MAILIRLELPVARTNKLGLLGADEEDLFSNLSKSSSQWQLRSINTPQVKPSWLLQKLGVVFEILLWWLVFRIELTVVAHVTILFPLLVLIAVICICFFKIIYNALLDSRLRLHFLLLNGRQRKLQTDFRLNGSTSFFVIELFAIAVHEEF